MLRCEVLDPGIVVGARSSEGTLNLPGLVIELHRTFNCPPVQFLDLLGKFSRNMSCVSIRIMEHVLKEISRIADCQLGHVDRLLTARSDMRTSDSSMYYCFTEKVISTSLSINTRKRFSFIRVKAELRLRHIAVLLSCFRNKRQKLFAAVCRQDLIFNSNLFLAVLFLRLLAACEIAHTSICDEA